MTSILLVEDDIAIAQPLLRALEREGFDVAHVTHGDDALTAPGEAVDIVLLDLTLPDLDGLSVCRTLRARDERLPIIMLTARSEEADIVVGLDAGADDYITKPFRLAELLARVRVRLRLATPRQPPRGAGCARRSGSTSGLAGRRRARSHAEGIRRVDAPRRRRGPGRCRGSDSCRKCGTSTTSARPARSTCTFRRCAGSWATTRPARV